MKIIEYRSEFEEEYIDVHNRAFAGEGSVYDNKTQEYDEEGRILKTFLADKKGEIVGLIDLVEVEEEETVEIDPICVLPEYRNEGIGSRLVQEGIEWAEERKGYERIRALISFKVEEWLYDFFEEHGFERVSKIFASKDGGIVEVSVEEGCPFSEEDLKGQVYIYERRISGDENI